MLTREIQKRILLHPAADRRPPEARTPRLRRAQHSGDLKVRPSC